MPIEFAASAAAARSGAPMPPPAPCPSTSAPCGSSTACRWTRAGPCGVSMSIAIRARRPRVAHMRYLVIETYVRGAEAVYARAARQGRMLPAGLSYLDSWVDAETLDRCFQLMETNDPNLFDEWTAQWNDLVDFEIVQVIDSDEAARRALS